MLGNIHNITYADVAHWPPPNYVDPVDRLWLPGLSIFCLSLSTVFLGGRLSLRFQRRSGPFGLDDVFIIVSWIFAVVLTGYTCVLIWHSQLGRHSWDIENDRRVGAIYQAFLTQVFFVLSTGFTKMSVLLFYRRIVKDVYSRVWIYIIWTCMFITASSTLAMFVVYMNICTPLHSYWDFPTYLTLGRSPPYTCLNGDAITISLGVQTIASDFWTAALPCAMFQIYNLGISRRQRIAMNIIFCLGLSATGVSIARTYFMWELGHSTDLSWVGYNLDVAGIIEVNLGIICSCAPFLRAFFRHYLHDRSFGGSAGRDTPSTEATLVEYGSCGSRQDSFTVGHGHYEGGHGSFTSQNGNLTALPRPLNTPDLYDQKTGMVVRAPGTGKLRTEWSSRPVSKMSD